MQISLTKFEEIDGLMASLLRMGDFMSCDDPRAYIRTSNKLDVALVDALGLDFVTDFADALECAAAVVAAALLGTCEVLDEEAV